MISEKKPYELVETLEGLNQFTEPIFVIGDSTRYTVHKI
jgi:hypothetical protein